jgi:alginate O-acetyltransferase complex protein AlgI
MDQRAGAVMPFNPLTFVFLLGPLFFIAYYSMPGRWRNPVCLGFSLLFYASAEPIFVFVALVSSALDFWLVALFVPLPSGRRRRLLAGIGVAQGLLILLYFKYAAFLYGALAGLLGLRPPLPNWLSPFLPLAISFITFEKITYVVDNYRGTGHQTRSIADYLTYVFLFPKLVAGPIVKYHEIAAYLEKHNPNSDDFALGLLRFGLGMVKKILIADNLAGTANAIFGLPAEQLSSGNAWLGALCFTFQIYFDFSGYSDMAIGMARMMGFPLCENFNQPYFAVSFSDFWRRWHMSLTTWIRDYLYIPLGGNRVPKWRVYANLIICFAVSGLWHGANWTFLLWGLYHGVFLVADRVGLAHVMRLAPRVVSVALTFTLVMFGWVLFRAPTLNGALGYVDAMFDPGRDVPPVVFVDQNLVTTLSVAAAICFLPESWRSARPKSMAMTRSAAMIPVAIALLFTWAGCRLAAATFTPFLYFRF